MSWTKTQAIDITRRHGCHGRTCSSAWPSRIGGCMGSPGRGDDPDRRTAPISLRSRAGGQRWSGFRDTQHRRVVRWPPWGRARQPHSRACSHLGCMSLGRRQDQGSRGAEDSLDNAGCWTPAPVWLDSEYCFVADTHVVLLALSRTGPQAVAEAGERRRDAFGCYRMSAGGTGRLTSPLASRGTWLVFSLKLSPMSIARRAQAGEQATLPNLGTGTA